jgi:hypothetical protein
MPITVSTSGGLYTLTTYASSSFILTGEDKRLHVVILKKSKRMRKEKTDRDPDLEVSGHGHRSGFSGTGFRLV